MSVLWTNLHDAIREKIMRGLDQSVFTSGAVMRQDGGKVISGDAESTSG